jgi:hypothetical protein
MRFFATSLACASLLTLAAAAEPPKKQTHIEIGKETTVLTEPLDEEGYVDFLEALNQEASRGVTPENNAAVPLWQAFGPAEVDEPLRDKFFKRLGMPVPAVEGDYFTTLEKFAKERTEEIQMQYDEANQRPWTRDEFPLLADWLAANEKPLALFVKASQRPRFYNPYLGNDESPSIVAVLLPQITLNRWAGRALSVRAMLQLGSGKTDAAIEDLQAIHRLARLQDQGMTLIDGLVAINIDTMALHGEAQLAQSGKLMAGELRKLDKALGELPPFTPMKDRIDKWERFAYLDVVTYLAKDNRGAAELLEVDETIVKLIGTGVDWNETMRLGNTWYDRSVAALSLPTRGERLDAMAKVEDQLHEMTANFKSGKRIAALLLTWGPKRKKLMGRVMGELTIGLMLPAVGAATFAEERTMVQHELTRVAIALAGYRAKHGSYPDELAKLSPEFIAKLPLDRISGNPLKYRREDDGYVVYSVGRNGEDDDGHAYDDVDDDLEGDDLVLRPYKPDAQAKER